MSEQTIISIIDATSTDTISLTRRRVLQMISASGFALTMAYYPSMATAVHSPTGKGYGPAPDLFKGEVTWEKDLSKEQLRALSMLGDIIIPADDHSPKASDLDIAGFVNEWVCAPYPQQQKDRKLLLDGLAVLNKAAMRREGQRFIDLDETSRLALFDDLAKNAKSDGKNDRYAEFFDRLVYLFVGGFYTTHEGMADIGYVGNVPMLKFNGPPKEIRQRLTL